MFGIFDSGVGGLSVVRLLQKRLPQAGFIYLGDTAHFPYGEKSREVIGNYAIRNTQFLIDKGARSIIIACHTASALAVNNLRRYFRNIKIYDIITPAIREIISAEYQKIGVIGTRATINSSVYKKKLKPYKVKVISHACPLLVSLIEEGWVDKPETESILQEYLKPLKKEKIEALVLSCTHYSLIEPKIRTIMGPKVRLIDPAKLLMEEIVAEGENHDLKKSSKKEKNVYVTDFLSRFEQLGQLFLGEKIKVKKAKTIQNV